MSQLQNPLSCTNPMILAPACARRKLAYPTGHRQFAPGPGVAAKGRIWAEIGVLQLALMKWIFSIISFITLCASEQRGFFSEVEIVPKPYQRRFLDLEALAQQNIVLSTKRIILPQFPAAQNPSILKVDQGYIYTFRVLDYPFVNHIGAVLLDESFDPISEPQLLDTRLENRDIESHSEDATIFTWQNRIYLLYNDNVEVNRLWWGDRRDMFIVELTFENGEFKLKPATKLIYEQKYFTQHWQKNWGAFIWKDCLLFRYTINPHEILYPNLHDGSCYSCYETKTPIEWEFGELRGSGAALPIDGQYLAFFHSGIQVTSQVTPPEEPYWHYFCGAYTFSAEPPFEITCVSPYPIVDKEFYVSSGLYKRIIFPGGFTLSGPHIYLAYGKDDCELWIAVIDREALMKSLVPVKK
jgi:hypothetical protein